MLRFILYVRFSVENSKYLNMVQTVRHTIELVFSNWKYIGAN